MDAEGNATFCGSLGNKSKATIHKGEVCFRFVHNAPKEGTVPYVGFVATGPTNLNTLEKYGRMTKQGDRWEYPDSFTIDARFYSGDFDVRSRVLTNEDKTSLCEMLVRRYLTSMSLH
jgi:hypothetical protein